MMELYVYPQKKKKYLNQKHYSKIQLSIELLSILFY